ncbi:MAG: hypothetical protein K8S54_15740 [Spirochaetia bacterium]|nr:hypothetical protein [Spirochaetia bacterium]
MKAEANPLREVNIAMVATTITLVIAIGLYVLLPRLHLVDLLKTKLSHQREFVLTPTGGEIRYTGGDVNRLKEDLEILGRRFKSSQFDMVTLQGSKFAPQVIAMQAGSAAYRYQIDAASDSATLRISGGPVAPVHEYLGYLKANWH